MVFARHRKGFEFGANTLVMIILGVLLAATTFLILAALSGELEGAPAMVLGPLQNVTDILTS